MRVGIIGAGRIAQVHARSVSDNPNTQLVAVTDPVEESARSLVERFGGRVLDSAEELIQSDEVDAVIVCSPTPFHAPQVLLAAQSGKPVLCEKPIAGSVEDAKKLLEDLDGLDARVMVGFNRRFDPSFAAAKDAADRGVLGTVEQVTIISRDPAAPPKEYIAVSGGIFADMTIHDFDMARFMLGDIAKVSAVGQNLDPELADTGDFDGAVVTLVTPEGHSATITNSRHCATGYDQRLEVFGSEGSVFADNVRPNTAKVSTAEFSDAQAPYLDFFLERYTEAYRIELQAFVDSVAGAREFVPSVSDGLEALRLAEAAAVSAREGRLVEL